MAEKVHKHWQQFFIFYLLVGRPTLQLRDTIHVLQFIIPSSTSILKYKINQLYITQISFCLLSFFLSIYLPSFLPSFHFLSLSIYFLSWLSWWPSQYRIQLQQTRPRINPWVRKIPWTRKWLLTPVFLPGTEGLSRHKEPDKT